MNSGCRPWLLVVVLVLGHLLGSGSSVAHADDQVEAAREHYDRGSRLYALGKFDEAVREYEAAYEAKDYPEFLFNIAQCYRLSGNSSRALFFFKSYLTRLPQAPNRAEVEGRILELERKVDAEHRDAEEERMRAAAAALAPPRHAVDLTSARRERIAGIITGSVGLVALAGGLACNGLAVKATGDLRNEAQSNSAFDPSIESRGRAFNVAGPALDVIGGVALATGAVLLGIGEWQIHRAREEASVRAAAEIAR